MPAPFTIVMLKDEDGDEFPIRLTGVQKIYRAADIEAAMQLIHEEQDFKPNGQLQCVSVEYFGIPNA